MSDKWRVCSFSPKCLFLAVWHLQSLNPFTIDSLWLFSKSGNQLQSVWPDKNAFGNANSAINVHFKIYFTIEMSCIYPVQLTISSVSLSCFLSIHPFDMKMWAHFIARKWDKCLSLCAHCMQCGMIFCVSSQLASAYKHLQTHTLDDYDDDDKCLLWMSSTTECTISNASKIRIAFKSTSFFIGSLFFAQHQSVFGCKRYHFAH